MTSNTNDSDTPRTNAEKQVWPLKDQNGITDHEIVYADFARQLERELNEALALMSLSKTLLNKAKEERDQWWACAKQLAEAYHEEESGPEPLIEALAAFDALEKSQQKI